MRQREAGLDLLRCLALFCVVTFHSFLYNGFYHEPQTGAAMLFANWARWFSTGCIGIFLMLTGYLKSEELPSRRYYRTLVPVLLGYLIAAAVSIPVRHFVLGDVQPFSVWVDRLFGFSAVYYGWYVEMFVGLTLISPIINIALRGLSGRRQLFWLAGTLLFLTALPHAFPVKFFPNWWRNLYPLTYYVLGAIVRRLQPRIPPWLGIGCAAGIAFLVGVCTQLSTEGTISEAFTVEFPDLWVVLIALFLFLGLYRVSPGKRIGRVLRFAAGGCYGGYLLSHLLDAQLYGRFPAWHTPEAYWKLFFCVTIPIFLISILAGRLLAWITRGKK